MENTPFFKPKATKREVISVKSRPQTLLRNMLIAFGVVFALIVIMGMVVLFVDGVKPEVKIQTETQYDK